MTSGCLQMIRVSSGYGRGDSLRKFPRLFVSSLRSLGRRTRILAPREARYRRRLVRSRSRDAGQGHRVDDTSPRRRENRPHRRDGSRARAAPGRTTARLPRPPGGAPGPLGLFRTSLLISLRVAGRLAREVYKSLCIGDPNRFREGPLSKPILASDVGNEGQPPGGLLNRKWLSCFESQFSPNRAETARMVVGQTHLG